MKKLYTQKNNGFTLVETLVAVTILVVASLGPIAIAAQGIASAAYAKDQVTASYLAQEGVEFVRHVRDSYALEHDGNMSNEAGEADYWLGPLVGTCLNSSGQQSGDCQVSAYDAISDGGNGEDKCTVGSTDTCEALKIQTNVSPSSPLSYFGYAGGSQTTQFTRTISIKNGTDDHHKIIEVRMDWVTKGKPKTYTLKENIFNAY